MNPTFVLINRIEACLWLAMAIGLAAGFTWRQRWSAVRIAGVAALVAFGASDVVETTTGAWWRPWWLFAWKTVCVLYFAVWLVSERQKGKGTGQKGKPIAP